MNDKDLCLIQHIRTLRDDDDDDDGNGNVDGSRGSHLSAELKC